MKQDLKVIILKGFVLLPNNELKVDLNISQNVLDTSEFFNDNKILVVTDFDSLEETINFDNTKLFLLTGSVCVKYPSSFTIVL